MEASHTTEGGLGDRENPLFLLPFGQTADFPVFNTPCLTFLIRMPFLDRLTLNFSCHMHVNSLPLSEKEASNMLKRISVLTFHSCLGYSVAVGDFNGDGIEGRKNLGYPSSSPNKHWKLRCWEAQHFATFAVENTEGRKCERVGMGGWGDDFCLPELLLWAWRPWNVLYGWRGFSSSGLVWRAGILWEQAGPPSSSPGYSGQCSNPGLNIGPASVQPQSHFSFVLFFPTINIAFFPPLDFSVPV